MGSGEVAIVALSTMISLKVTFSDGLGGNLKKEETSYQSEKPGEIPITDSKMNVKAISFRDKDNGWKKYLMKITLTV